MISEVDIDIPVAVQQNVMDPNSVPRHIVADALLKQLAFYKACENGYVIAVTNLNTVSQGHRYFWSEKIIYQVNCRCRFFKPVVGETMNGVVLYVAQEGAYIEHGPMKRVYLPAACMRYYTYFSGEEPAFVKDDGSIIQKGVVVRFKIVFVQWMGYNCREFKVLANVDVNEGLGPVSLNGEDGLDL